MQPARVKQTKGQVKEQSTKEAHNQLSKLYNFRLHILLWLTDLLRVMKIQSSEDPVHKSTQKIMEKVREGHYDKILAEVPPDEVTDKMMNTVISQVCSDVGMIGMHACNIAILE